MEMMNCERITIPEEGKRTLDKTDRLEMIYYVASGDGLLVIDAPDAQWKYPLQSQTAIWIPENTQHELQNSGIGNLECICFACEL